ncbi:uncharacterized protein BDCG_03860 [Blastomyces dermatitidis ER-3]|uniref:Uncharacterized protein n=2 Tax=Blastomyces TaxID=229219 RepID=A0A179UB77_BLAGS|nr:uncharacterized protein BDBG_01695 [Blastomyces gilchristii SLH14081]XP_045275808.1 uncharacterized protein BDCG_03860 [Blastomyces dermatitidis ER-3]EEQ88740.2 hypothetical protein BDCG_03860 [Blastomyces dermatitidis ER-3]EQL38867.1 hypothetical protein BDFG_00388 [Blastomyces dermatitidis ATCC 26199]OAT05275.1 hypothetical protein BDBG_01695 [Blastomyces gilchristii SLH14081]
MSLYRILSSGPAASGGVQCGTERVIHGRKSPQGQIYHEIYQSPKWVNKSAVFKAGCRANFPAKTEIEG